MDSWYTSLQKGDGMNMQKLMKSEKDGILQLKINRQEVRNAIDFDLMDEFESAITQIKDNATLKGVVLIGEGERAFCSGGDLSVFHQLKTKEEAFNMLSRMGNILYEWMTLPIPTFSILNGTAVGGGCEIATACDFRIAKRSAKVGFIQGKLAITTGWGGASMLFEKLPHAQAMEMLCSAKVYTAKEAHALGFITKIVEDDYFEQEAYEYINTVTACSVDVLKAYKQNKVLEWKQRLKEKMEEEINRCSILWEKEEHINAVNQFLSQ